MKGRNFDSNFLSKLRFLSGDRDIWPWLGSLGLTAGTIGRILKGQEPPSFLLRMLVRVERVSLRWLEENRDPPYLVTRALTDIEGAETIGALLDEESWDVYLVCAKRPGSGDWAAVLTLPAAFERDDANVSYVAVEVIAGNLGKSSLAACIRQGRVHWVSAGVETLNDLAGGWIGNQRLLGWSDARRSAAGLLDVARPLADVAELPPSTDRREEEAYERFVEREKEVSEMMHRLRPADRKMIAEIVRRMASAPLPEEDKDEEDNASSG